MNYFSLYARLKYWDKLLCSVCHSFYIRKMILCLSGGFGHDKFLFAIVTFKTLTSDIIFGCHLLQHNFVVTIIHWQFVILIYYKTIIICVVDMSQAYHKGQL